MSKLWKESYLIGEDTIDRQHMGLFDQTEHLLETIQEEDTAARKEECIRTVQYLKEYSIEHFEAEEKYQESIKYNFLDAHKTIHQRFIGNVLEAEKKMIDSDFSMPSIKEFTGFLTAWLTYHVAGADRKIKTGEKITDDRAAKEDRYVDFFMSSIQNLLETMFGQDSNEISIVKYIEDKNAVHVTIKLVGDCDGYAVISFPQKTILNFVKTLTLMDYEVVDEMAYSVLSEISNIVCGNVATMVSSKGLACDIKAPELAPGKEKKDNDEMFCFDTTQGQIAVTLHLTH